MAGKRRYRRRRRKKNAAALNWKVILPITLAIVLGLTLTFCGGLFSWRSASDSTGSSTDDGRPAIDVQLLTPNKYSRPQIALTEINGIVIHYTANPGASAQQNRDYFEGLADSHETHASSHFIVGLEGEIIQCIPSSEISYASNKRNYDTLSIECCHPDSTGKFNQATYDSAVELTAWLCRHFGVSSDNVIRHYDITGKDCPKYFVEHEDAWTQFKQDVQEKIDEY